MYVSEKISGLKMTKVTYKGKKQYKLALTNPQKTFAADFDPEGDEDSSPSYYGLLNLGGKTFYTNYHI